MSEFQPFLMERMMSRWENLVDYNLSESGVHPVSLRELLADDAERIDALLGVELNYPQANGIVALRERIAALYEGAAPDNVLVTVGAAEANYLAIQTLLEAGDEIVMMLPNYMQIWGVSHNRGVVVRPLRLREDAGFALDLDELAAAVTEKTKLVAICNPNNPTGRIMSDAEMQAVVDAAGRVGAWILADEVYSGAERNTDAETPSFFGRYDKVLAIGSLSKAYGLPGLRTGWVVGPAATVDAIWRRHEYTTIAATMLANELATIALSPGVRPGLLARTRRFIREGYPILEEWLREHGDLFSLSPPQAAAIAFVRYRLDVNSTELVERLYTEKSVLIVPGDHFGMDGFLRISFGLPHDYLRAGLARIDSLLEEIRGSNGR